MVATIVDAHAHLFPQPGYLVELLATCDRLGIEKVCLSGLGDAFALSDNAAVARALIETPDRVIGFYFIRLGEHRIEEVERAVAVGFRGLKFTIPYEPYDHESYFPLYERAQSYGLPCLFHTGIVTTARYVRSVSSAKMRPVHLEAVAREFPRLACICAHLGIPWHEEAAALARIIPNIYVDITGAPGGWRVQKDVAFFRSLLYWPDAWHKVLWGSDVHCTDLEAALRRDQALVETLTLSAEMKAAFFGGTFLSLLPPQ